MTHHILADLRPILKKFKASICVGVEVPDYVYQECINLAMDSMIFDDEAFSPDFARLHNFHRDNLAPNLGYSKVFAKAFDEFVQDVRGYMQSHGLYNGNGFSYIPELHRLTNVVMRELEPPQYFTESR